MEEEHLLPKISVIIPAYNSGKTITRAVRSVLAQTYANIEVVVIDDGSTDDTSEVVRALVSEDSRIRLIIKPNGGVSAARNDGIMAAEGEWFVTLDADDYIDRDMLHVLYQAAVDNGADTVICGFRMVYDSGKKTTFRVGEDYSDEKSGFLDTMFVDLYDRHMISTHSNQLYNMAIVRKNRLMYNEKIAVNEDIDFVLRYLKLCSVIAVVKGAYLNYVQHEEGKSLITTFQSYGIASSLLILRDCNELFDETEISDETIDAMNNRLFWHICSFVGLMYYRSAYSDLRKIEEIKELCEKEEFNDLLQDLKPEGMKTRLAHGLLHSRFYTEYHRLCLILYRNNERPEKLMKESGTSCDAYRMLGIESHVDENGESLPVDEPDQTEGKIREYSREADVIDRAFIEQTIAEETDSAPVPEQEEDYEVTELDLRKVRELLKKQ